MLKHVLAVLALFPLAASAAPTVGTFELSGGTNLGFLSYTREYDLGPAGKEETDVTQWALNGRGLYTVAPNLSVGARLAYTSLTQKPADSNEFGASTLFLGPAVALETEVQPSFSVFAVASAGYARATERAPGIPDQTGNGFGFGIEGGGKYWLSRAFSLNASLGYDWVKVTADEIAGITPERTDSGFALNLGLSVYLDAVKK